MKLAGQGDDRDRAPIARRFRRPFHAQAFKPPSRRRTAHLPSLVVSTVRFTIQLNRCDVRFCLAALG
jgi:hypothetical protein